MREWAWVDGARIETRGPAEDEVEKIDGETQSLGFGGHSDKTYDEVTKKNPKYAEYLMGKGWRGRSAEKKFAERTNRKEIAIVSKEEKVGSSERWEMRREGRSL